MRSRRLGRIAKAAHARLGSRQVNQFSAATLDMLVLGWRQGCLLLGVICANFDVELVGTTRITKGGPAVTISAQAKQNPVSANVKRSLDLSWNITIN